MFDGKCKFWCRRSSSIYSGIVKRFWWIIVVIIKIVKLIQIHSHFKSGEKSHEQTVNTQSIHILMNCLLSFYWIHAFIECWFDGNKISEICLVFYSHKCDAQRNGTIVPSLKRDEQSNRRLIYHYGNYADFRILCTFESLSAGNAAIVTVTVATAAVVIVFDMKSVHSPNDTLKDH